MRAYFYFTKLQRYGDVPYYDEVIGSKDEELLYKPRDSRKYVMQKVVEDLDSAIYMLPETKTPYEVNKWTALALKSRATLFEGTFRKYHNLGDWEEMLQQSAAASLELIQKGGFSLYKTGSTPYRDLFARLDAPAEEMRELFKDLPEACDNTLEIAERYGPQSVKYRYNVTSVLTVTTDKVDMIVCLAFVVVEG